MSPNRRKRPAKKILIPASTPGCTVFPYDRINHTFKTAHYTQSLTHGRVTHTEVDQLLEKVSVPVAKWFKDYGMTVQRQRMFFWLQLISIILLPLFPVYLCYRSCRKKKVHRKLLELRKNVVHLINTNGHSYVQRQLVWHIPPHFPLYIELKDKAHPSYVPAGKAGAVKKVHPHPQAFPMQSGYSQPNMGIQMMPMQQQPGYGYNMPPGYMTPYSPSGYPMTQGGYYQPQVVVVEANQYPVYGTSYYS